jgi:hypothetical protein
VRAGSGYDMNSPSSEQNLQGKRSQQRSQLITGLITTIYYQLKELAISNPRFKK